MHVEQDVADSFVLGGVEVGADEQDAVGTENLIPGDETVGV
jgi:hypothetical protein